jgi:hypothetical protein
MCQGTNVYVSVCCLRVLRLPASAWLCVSQAVEYETTLANITELEEALALAQEQVCGQGGVSCGGGGGAGQCDGTGCACPESAGVLVRDKQQPCMGSNISGSVGSIQVE